jgi:proteasome lid subunit RPN8/RPN11
MISSLPIFHALECRPEFVLAVLHHEDGDRRPHVEAVRPEVSLTLPGLHLPAALADVLWTQARLAQPQECVGLLGGQPADADGLWLAAVQAVYPLPNSAAAPERRYQVAPGPLLRALRALEAQGQVLVGLYHSHPLGPATPSATDRQQAAYSVPYLIADLASGTLRAYLLPAGQEVPLHATQGPASGPSTRRAQR